MIVYLSHTFPNLEAIVRVQIEFEDFTATLLKALQGTKTDRVEVAFCLEPSNEFTVIDGDQRTTWQMKMPPRMSDTTWTLYALLTHILDFRDLEPVYEVFNEAIKGNKSGWVVIVVTPHRISAEHRDTL